MSWTSSLDDPAGLIGRDVGNYRVVRLLGEGGMGAVYEAEHPDIGRRVAVKVLRPEYSRDETAVARFFREARTANKVRHPNLVQVLDLGQVADGMVYAIMELLDGESLGARLRRGGALSLADALAMFAPCADALHALHAGGVFHRDFKPDNVFLANEHGTTCVKLLDFGLAKLTDGGDVRISTSGVIMGTPLYMAPEQCQGSSDVDAAVDQYALACVLFEMLCGGPPFSSESVPHLLVMQVSAPPPRLRTIRSDLPEQLEQAIDRALAKHKRDRFPDVSAFAAAVIAATREVAGVSLPAVIAAPRETPDVPPPALPLPAAATTLGRSAGQLASRTRPSRLPRWLVAGAVAVVACAVAISVIVSRRDEPPRPPPTAATSPTPAGPAAACDAGDAAACNRMGVMHFTRTEAPRDVQEAERRFERACELGSGAGCANFAHALALRNDPAPALEALAAQCTRKPATAVASVWLGHPHDIDKACKAGASLACFIVARETVDDAAFRSIYERLDEAIELDFYRLRALMLLGGLGRPRDVEGALRLLERGCRRGDPVSCTMQQCVALPDPKLDVDTRMRQLTKCHTDLMLDDKTHEERKGELMNELMRKPKPKPTTDPRELFRPQ